MKTSKYNVRLIAFLTGLFIVICQIVILSPVPVYAEGSDATSGTSQYLAFTSDVHNKSGNVSATRLGSWIDIMKDRYNISYMGFCGDMADYNAGSESKYWQLAQTVIDTVSTKNIPVCYTTGNHEYNPGKFENKNNPTKDYITYNAPAPDIPADAKYQIYALGAANDAQSSKGFESNQFTELTKYLNTTDSDKPVIILSHFPLHYLQNTSTNWWSNNSRSTANAGDMIDLLNDAADDGKTIVFLWGHNHTNADSNETNYDKIYTPGSSITYQSDSSDTIQFYYAAAGCMSDTDYSAGSHAVKGKGLVLQIKPDHSFKFAYFDADGNFLHGHTLEKVEASPATCTENGNTAYWECTGCIGLFSDAEGLNEIRENSWVINKTGHDYDCQSYSNGTVTYRCSRCNDELTAAVDTGSLSDGQFDMQGVLDSLADEIDLTDQNLSVNLEISVGNATPGNNGSIIYDVHPRAAVYSGETLLDAVAIPNDQIANDASFTFRLDVPDSLVTQPGDKHYVKVTHTKVDQTTECSTYPVKGSAGNYYVNVTTSSFSSFELEEVTVSDVGDCIVTVSLTLSDEIAINLYVKTLKSGTNADDYSVIYSFNGSTTRSSLGTADSSGRYKFEVARCAAKEMTDSVHFEVIYTNPSTNDTTVIKSIDYSIRKYCTDTIDEGTDEYLKALCKSVLDYGASAQQFFGYKTQTLANAGDKYTAGTAAINDVSGLTGYPASTTMGDGTTMITGSLSLLSKLELNFYFYGSTCTEDATVTTGENDNSVVVTTTRDTENGRVKVTVGNIAARYLGDTYTVTLGNSSVTYSPMTYAQLYQNATKEGMICKCLYHYYRNALDYFNHKAI